jgi:hypothetical protein
MKTNVWKMTTLGFATAFGLALAMPAATADKQPHMRAALGYLQSAKAQLAKATADKGGHRVKAMAAVDTAIAEVQAGIKFDNQH